MNNLLIDALHCRNKGRPPVWLMRQAGRYMPEYRAIRSKYSFTEMFHTPELIVEVTELPIRRFGFDAAILFSDILIIPEALDVGLRFEDKIGPVIEHPVRSIEDIKKLPTPLISEKLDFVAKGIRELKRRLKVPLLGFCGAPFTVASYMIEGGTSKDFKTTKQWMIRDKVSFELLLDKISKETCAYIDLQIANGVDALQIFDSWAWCLDNKHFREVSLKYIDRLVKHVNGRVPVIVFCRGSSVFAKMISEIKPAAISIDWNADLSQLRNELPSGVALQGNLDPDILYGDRFTVRKHVKDLLDSMKGDEGYIFNLGHGIHPDIPTESVQELVDTIKNC